MTELELKKQEIAKQIVEDAQTGVSNGDYDTLGDALTYQVRRHEEAFAEVPNMPPSKAKEVYLQRINEGFNNPREEVAKFLELSREKGGVYSSTEAANDDPFLPAGITYLVEPDDDDEVSDFKRVSGRFVTKSTDDFVENMPVYRWGQKAAAGMIGRLGDLRMPYTKEGTEAGAATLTNLATLPPNLAWLATVAFGYGGKYGYEFTKDFAKQMYNWMIASNMEDHFPTRWSDEKTLIEKFNASQKKTDNDFESIIQPFLASIEDISKWLTNSIMDKAGVNKEEVDKDTVAQGISMVGEQMLISPMLFSWGLRKAKKLLEGMDEGRMTTVLKSIAELTDIRKKQKLTEQEQFDFLMGRDVPYDLARTLSKQSVRKQRTTAETMRLNLPHAFQEKMATEAQQAIQFATAWGVAKEFFKNDESTFWSEIVPMGAGIGGLLLSPKFALDSLKKGGKVHLGHAWYVRLRNSKWVVDRFGEEQVSEKAMKRRYKSVLYHYGVSVKDVAQMEKLGTLESQATSILNKMEDTRLGSADVGLFLESFKNLTPQAKREIFEVGQQQYDALLKISNHLHERYDVRLDLYIDQILNITMLDNLRRQMIQAEAGGGTAHIVKGFFRKFGVLKGTRIVGTADKLREEQEKLMQGTALFLKDIRIAADNAKGTSDELPLKQLVNELAEANLGIELSVQQASGNINKVLDNINSSLTGREMQNRNDLVANLRNVPESMDQNYGNNLEIVRDDITENRLSPTFLLNNQDRFFRQKLYEPARNKAKNLYDTVNFERTFEVNNFARILQEAKGTPTYRRGLRDIFQEGIKPRTLIKILDQLSVDVIDSMSQQELKELITDGFTWTSKRRKPDGDTVYSRELISEKDKFFEELDEKLREETIGHDAYIEELKTMALKLNKELNRMDLEKSEQGIMEIPSELSLREIGSALSHFSKIMRTGKSKEARRQAATLYNALKDELIKQQDDVFINGLNVEEGRTIDNFLEASENYYKFSENFSRYAGGKILSKTPKGEGRVPSSKTFDAYADPVAGIDNSKQFKQIYEDASENPDVQEEMVTYLRYSIADNIQQNNYSSVDAGNILDAYQEFLSESQKELLRKYRAHEAGVYKSIQSNFQSEAKKLKDVVNTISNKKERRIAQSALDALVQPVNTPDQFFELLSSSQIVLKKSNFTEREWKQLSERLTEKPVISPENMGFKKSEVLHLEWDEINKRVTTVIDENLPELRGETDNEIVMSIGDFLSQIKPETKEHLAELFLQSLYTKSVRPIKYKASKGLLTESGSREIGLLEQIDIVEFTRLLEESREVRKVLFPPEINAQLEVARKAGATGAPVIEAVESALAIMGNYTPSMGMARVFAIARGIISVRYVLGELAIRQLQTSYYNSIKQILKDPHALDVIMDVVGQTQKQIDSPEASRLIPREWFAKKGGALRMLTIISGNRAEELGMNEEEAYQFLADHDKYMKKVMEGFRAGTIRKAREKALGLEAIEARTAKRGEGKLKSRFNVNLFSPEERSRLRELQQEEIERRRRRRQQTKFGSSGFISR